jgi:hypothetical protein
MAKRLHTPLVWIMDISERRRRNIIVIRRWLDIVVVVVVVVVFASTNYRIVQRLRSNWRSRMSQKLRLYEILITHLNTAVNASNRRNGLN